MRSSGSAEASGHLVVPVAGVRPAELSDSYGAPRSGGPTHEGLDILAPEGTPVLAAAAVKEGDLVRQGEVVAYVGETGESEDRVVPFPDAAASSRIFIQEPSMRRRIADPASVLRWAIAFLAGPAGSTLVAQSDTGTFRLHAHWTLLAHPFRSVGNQTFERLPCLKS